jgi:hypothetical protein
MRWWLLAATLMAAPGLLAARGRTGGDSVEPDPRPALSATGTIQRFDSATRLLTLKTVRGSESFVIADSTMLRRGAKVVPLQDLGKWNGSRAKVRYTEAEGHRTASSVMVGSRQDLSASPPPPGSGSESPKRSAIR